MTEQPPLPRPAYAWYCLGVICFAYLFGFMDRIIVGLLTPAIQKDIGTHRLRRWASSRDWRSPSSTPCSACRSAGRRTGTSRKWLLDRRHRDLEPDDRRRRTGAQLLGTVHDARRRRRRRGHAEPLRHLAHRRPCSARRRARRPSASTPCPRRSAPASPTSAAAAILGFIGVPAPAANTFDMPVLGAIPAWQAVFIIIGLAGLVPALLMALTVREPARRDLAGASAEARRTGPRRAHFSARTAPRCSATTSASPSSSLADLRLGELAADVFVRLHGWTVPKFSIWYGIVRRPRRHRLGDLERLRHQLAQAARPRGRRRCARC